MHNHTPLQLSLWHARPHSYSQHTSFKEYSKEEWYQHYILGYPTPANVMMTFGSTFGKSVENRKPMAPVIAYEHMEYPLKVKTPWGLELVGYMDTWEPEQRIMRDYKTGPKLWDQKRVDNHKQFDFYAFELYLIDKIKPEDIQFFIDWIPCEFKDDGTYGFKLNERGEAQIHTFETKRTMTDILRFAKEIKETRKEMEEFIENRGKI
jgi:hypothetical protein